MCLLKYKIYKNIMKLDFLNSAIVFYLVYLPPTTRYFFSFQYRLMFLFFGNVKCVQDNLFIYLVYSHFSTFSVNINNKNVISSPLRSDIPRRIPRVVLLETSILPSYTIICHCKCV